MSVCAQSRSSTLLRRRHAEHLGDHPERQREREVADHVHLASTFNDDGVEGVVDHRLHAGGQLLDRAGGEHLLHQLAQPRVVGGIEVEELVGAPLRAVAEDLLPELGAGVDAHDAAVLDAQAGVPQQADGVVVAEQRPEAEGRLLDRVGRGQLRVLGVRILREARLERVEGFRLTGHISHSATRGCGEDEHDRGGRGPRGPRFPGEPYRRGRRRTALGRAGTGHRPERRQHRRARGPRAARRRRALRRQGRAHRGRAREHRDRRRHGRPRRLRPAPPRRRARHRSTAPTASAASAPTPSSACRWPRRRRRPTRPSCRSTATSAARTRTCCRCRS